MEMLHAIKKDKEREVQRNSHKDTTNTYKLWINRVSDAAEEVQKLKAKYEGKRLPFWRIQRRSRLSKEMEKKCKCLRDLIKDKCLKEFLIDKPPAPSGGRDCATVSCVVAVLFVLVLLAVLFIYYIRISRFPSAYATAKYMSEYTQPQTTVPGYEKHSGGALVVSAEDHVTSQKGSSTEIVSLEENRAALMGFSLSKKSHFSSPGFSDSVSVGNHASLHVRSPDKLIGELYFLDDAMTPEELFNAPSEVLGNNCHGTSYNATLENDFSLRVKWLREGLAKQRKEFSVVAKIFANIKHPNVVGLRGYY